MGPQTFITGATGFIGRALTRSLLERGQSVRVLARSAAKAHALFGREVEVTVGSLDEPAALARGCRGAGHVYHVAGHYCFGLRRRRELWRTNVVGTKNLLRAAGRAGVERIVHLSSGGVLENRDAGLLTENDFPARPPRWSAYKNSKWEAERLVLAWAARGLPVTIASTTCPIGRGDEAPTPTGCMIRDFLHGRFPFSCHTGLNFIGVDDLAEGLQQVAATGRPGQRYLLGDENLWLDDFLRRLARVSDREPPAFCLPGALVRVLGAVGEVADLLGSRARTARICLETGLQAGRCQFFSNAKAQRELGWRPVRPLREAMQQAVAWFRDEGPAELAFAPPAEAPVGSHVP